MNLQSYFMWMTSFSYKLFLDEGNCWTCFVSQFAAFKDEFTNWFLTVLRNELLLMMNQLLLEAVCLPFDGQQHSEFGSYSCKDIPSVNRPRHLTPSFTWLVIPRELRQRSKSQNISIYTSPRNSLEQHSSMPAAAAPHSTLALRRKSKIISNFIVFMK